MNNPFLAGLKANVQDMSLPSSGIRVTKLEKIDGIWHANVTVAGTTTHVIRQGAWRSEKDDKGCFHFVRAPIVLILQDKVRRLENREKRQSEREEVTA